MCCECVTLTKAIKPSVPRLHNDGTECMEIPSAGTTNKLDAAAEQSSIVAAITISSRKKILEAGFSRYKEMLLELS